MAEGVEGGGGRGQCLRRAPRPWDRKGPSRMERELDEVVEPTTSDCSPTFLATFT